MKRKDYWLPGFRHGRWEFMCNHKRTIRKILAVMEPLNMLTVVVDIRTYSYYKIAQS
jgi:hypothetical protein